MDAVGKPVRAADLDQLSAGDDHLPVPAERGKDEKRGGGIVVDDHGRLGAGEPPEELFDGRVALAAEPGLHVDLQVAAPVEAGQGAGGARGQDSAAEAGMENDPGGIDHGPQAVGILALEDVAGAVDDLPGGGGGVRGTQGGAGAVDRLPHPVHHDTAGPSLEEVGGLGTTQDGADGGQPPARFGHGIRGSRGAGHGHDSLAEVDGSRTHLPQLVRHNGFEDREGHRAPFTSAVGPTV